MDKGTRNRIQAATQKARALLEDELGQQLEGVFDIRPDGTIGAIGPQLTGRQRIVREKILAAIEHQRTSGRSPAEAVAAYTREAAFTTLNRFVALKMLEARELLLPCISHKEQSIGFREYARLGLADGLVQLDDHGYRLYLESLFDEIAYEVGVLFDRSDPASLLWPRAKALSDLLEILNDPELAGTWGVDETIGWIYQFFNSDDERKTMKDPKLGGSQTPRNSRELAVRNQFFTPRYVVEFLTDNTLGRVWFEMMRGQTRLLDHCRRFVSRPEDGTAAAFRHKKDPRELKILDPACGSGHFLLYAFDVLLLIYEEAWADSEAASWQTTGHCLREDYPSLDYLHRALPCLILEYNLHGIDIDSRCTQIAALALWMRSQRAYAEAGIAAGTRPVITRTNIVLAEPMPGDLDLRREFLEGLDTHSRELVQRVFEKMELAGEAGSLLRIEEDIGAAVRDVYGEMGGLFVESDEQRWRHAEGEVMAALGAYVERASSADSYARKLFTNDAARGLAFIDLCRQRYDVVLMNPPFGEATESARSEIISAHPEGRNDLYGGFVLAGVDRVESGLGLVGALTSRTFLLGRGMRAYRKALVSNQDHALTLLADLGGGVLDGAWVEVCAYTVGRNPSATAFFLDKRTDPDMCEADAGLSSWIPKKLSELRAAHDSQFAYTLDATALRNLAASGTLEPGIGRVTKGLSTGDDVRFVRARWEVPEVDSKGWALFSKGGEYSWLSGDVHLTVKRHEDGHELAAFAERGDGNVARTRQSSAYYGLPAVTWSRRSAKGLSARRLRPGAVFSDKSPVVVAHPTLEEWLPALIPVLSSSEYMTLIRGQVAGGSFETGVFKRLPIPDERVLCAKDAWLDVYRLADSFERHDETALLFVAPAPSTWSAVSTMSELLELLGNALSACDLTLDAEVKRLQVALGDELEVTLGGIAPRLSFLVGVALGRFDPKTPSPTSDLTPFDPLPVASRRERGLADTPRDLPFCFVDDPGQSNDITTAVWRAFDEVDETLLASGESPDSVPEPYRDLRHWLRGGFFDYHLKRYSKSRRRAPIYWQLATTSANYSVWLYYHLLTKDSLYRVLNDHATLKLHHEERRLNELIQSTGINPAANERKVMDEQRTLVHELRAFCEELARIAPLWNPELSDGVAINSAPLWRLVPQHRGWQKECRACWGRLVGGDLDWAHLAMHLWPERVVPKCARDRSLAIAHGLEEEFWAEDADGKWASRQIDSASVERLVQERSSAAVKAALADLLAAG